MDARSPARIPIQSRLLAAIHLFREALVASDLVVPDGIGVVLASRLLGGRIRRRVTGFDIFHGLNLALGQ